jgi:glycosyltransferase involved in cell wall biosynthesis
VLNGTLGAPRREFFPRETLDWSRPSLTTICGLHPRKGIADLLNAFDIVAAQHRDAQLHLVGDGPHREEYEALARGLRSGDRIIFHGQLHDTKSVLAQTDIFVLASHADPCPLAIPEAREAGCAIVATAVDGIPQSLDNGVAGLLVPKKDPAAFAAAINSLLDDPGKLAAMKIEASRNLAFWSTARVADQTADVYAELLPLDRRVASASGFGSTREATSS